MPETENNNGTDAPRNLRGPMMPQIIELTEAIAGLDSSLTDLKRVNTIIKEVQTMMNMVADKGREGVTLVQENRFIWVNKAACVISGYTFDELMAISVPDITLPSHRDKFTAKIKMILAGDTFIAPQEWPIYRKDRMVSYVKIFSYRVIFREKPAIVSIFYDVTENKKLLDESMMRAQMLDAINDGVILNDMSGKIVYVNDSACESVGYTKDEMLAMNVLDLTAPELSKRFNIRMKQISEHKEARFNTVVVRKDGSRLNIEVRARIIKQGGKPFALSVARGIPRSDSGDNISKIQG